MFCSGDEEFLAAYFDEYSGFLNELRALPKDKRRIGTGQSPVGWLRKKVEDMLVRVFEVPRREARRRTIRAAQREAGRKKGSSQTDPGTRGGSSTAHEV